MFCATLARVREKAKGLRRTKEEKMAKRSDKKRTDAASALCISMLGTFTILEEPLENCEAVLFEGAPHTASLAEIAANLTGRAHRLWLLVAYLVVNRGRGVATQELIDLLWPEVKSNNPSSTLQNNVSRARSLFADENFFGSRDLIKHTDGLYYWAPDRTTSLDIELFESNARSIGETISADDPAALDHALKTCRMYKGDFLAAAADAPWCANLALYYRALYKRICRTTVEALLEAGRLKEAQELCLRANTIDPDAEEFSILLMQAFLLDDDPASAIDHYHTVSAYLSENYDIRPSAELETHYEIAQQELFGRSVTEESIRTFLFESSEDEGAFACSNAVFREIALLRMREMERSGAESHIIAITIDHRALNNDRRIINAKRVAQVLSTTLRASDPFTKVGSNQFLVLLPGANAQNAQMVYDRIVERFRSAFPRADVAFNVYVASLRALQ